MKELVIVELLKINSPKFERLSILSPKIAPAKRLTQEQIKIVEVYSLKRQP